MLYIHYTLVYVYVCIYRGVYVNNIRRAQCYHYSLSSYVSSFFYRDFDTASPLAGLGYGLPISRNYARYFDGELTVSACLYTLLCIICVLYSILTYISFLCIHVYDQTDNEYGGVRHGQLHIPASTGRLALCRAAVSRD